jgi:hypothetical protein
MRSTLTSVISILAVVIAVFYNKVGNVGLNLLLNCVFGNATGGAHDESSSYYSRFDPLVDNGSIEWTGGLRQELGGNKKEKQAVLETLQKVSW